MFTIKDISNDISTKLSKKTYGKNTLMYYGIHISNVDLFPNDMKISTMIDNCKLLQAWEGSKCHCIMCIML